MSARSRAWVIVVLVGLSWSFAAPGDAAGEPPCHAVDEWESPARIEPLDWCRAWDQDHAFYVRDGETISVFTRATSEQDLELCLIDPAGSVVLCHDTGGPGNAETIQSWVSTSAGYWRSRVFPVGPEYGLSLSLGSFLNENDCGIGSDASESFAPADPRPVPNTAVCVGDLPAADPADLYQVWLEVDGRLALMTDVASRLCIYAPRGHLAGGCADVAPDEVFEVPLDESGMWRYGVLQRQGGGPEVGEYRLGAIHTPTNHPPAMATLACGPQDQHAGDPVECEFRASEPDGDLLYYLVSWGDGTVDRVPASGFVTQALPKRTTHAFASAGTQTIEVRAFDNRTPALGSSALAASVRTINARPQIAIDCAPLAPRPGDEVACTFAAADDSTGVFYTASWGDGAPPTRVPAQGHVQPGVAQTLRATFVTQGLRTFTVSATDDGAPAATGVASRTFSVAAAAPSAPVIDCPTTPGSVGAPITCSFRANDVDSGGIYFRVDWGDGSVERVPSTGFVAPGAWTSASHAYSTSGYRTVRANASDDTPVPQTGPRASTEIAIGTFQIANGSHLVGTGIDINSRLAPGSTAIDGTWVPLAATGRGNASTAARLIASGPGTNEDVDVWFYDAERRARLDAGECSRLGNGPEACSAPAGAAWALVRSSALAPRAEWRLTYLH